MPLRTACTLWVTSFSSLYGEHSLCSLRSSLEAAQGFKDCSRRGMRISGKFLAVQA